MIEIENYRKGPQFDGDRSLATFDVRRGESFYIDLRLLSNKNGHKYVAYPVKKRRGSDGKDMYVRVYDWGKARNEEFDKAVMESLKYWGHIEK